MASCKYISICQEYGFVKHLTNQMSGRTLSSEAQKPKTFRIAAVYAQFFSGRSARIHFLRHIKKARNPLSRHIKKT